jgi:phosphatidate cytidylyltransferase
MASGKPFDWSNLRLRVLSATVLVPVTVAVFWFGGPAFLIVLSVAVALLTAEWGAMAAPEAPYRIALAMSVGVLAAVFAAYLGNVALAWLILPLGAALAAGAARLGGWGERAADAALGVLYIGAPVLALLWLRLAASGRDWSLMLLACAWCADIFAFLVGSALKGPKLWPRFSPNKTWSGFVGGLIAAALAGLLVVFLAKGDADPSLRWAAPIGLLAGLATMAGDLWESMLKRRFGVKDSGGLIPGHGGLLDRVDGLMFASIAMAGARLVAHLNGAPGTIG